MKSPTEKIAVSENTGDAAQNAAICRRLEKLLERHSLSVLATKTGTHVSNVHMYVKKGRRVPAEFCAALVAGLGVNPAWLLTGEGAMYLADVTASTASMADGALELVSAMNAISRQSLGSLLGKRQATTLRQLDEALTAHEKLREQLGERFVPIFRKLLDDFRSAIRAEEMNKAASLRNALRQVSRLANDSGLDNDFLSANADYENHCRNFGTALDMRREAFLRRLFASDGSDDDLLEEASSLAVTFDVSLRTREALRIARTALAWFRGTVRDKGGLHLLEGCVAQWEVDSGQLLRGMRRLQRLLVRRLSETPHPSLKNAEIRGHFFAAALSFDALVSLDIQTDYHRGELLRFACWLEKPDALKKAIALQRLEPEHMDLLAECLLALHGKEDRKKVFARFDAARPEVRDTTLANIGEHIRGAVIAIAWIQLLNAGGERTRARKLLLKCDELLRSIPKEYTLDLLWRATHYRSILRLVPESEKDPVYRKLRERATRFFQWYVKRGYHCFADLAPAKTAKSGNDHC